MDAVEENNPPDVAAGWELRPPKRPPGCCEVAAVVPGVERVGGLGWELFKLAKREVMIGDWSARGGEGEKGGGRGRGEGEEELRARRRESAVRRGDGVKIAATRKQWRGLDAQSDAEQ